MFGFIKTKNLYLVRIKRYEYSYYELGKKYIKFSSNNTYYAAHLKRYEYSYKGHYNIFKLCNSKTKIYADLIAYRDEAGDLYALDPVYIGDAFKVKYINKNKLNRFVKYYNDKLKEGELNEEKEFKRRIKKLKQERKQYKESESTDTGSINRIVAEISKLIDDTEGCSE